jgi:hypothetical protein
VATIYNTVMNTDSHKRSFTAVMSMFPLSTGSKLNFDVKKNNTLHKPKKSEKVINVTSDKRKY